MANLPHLNRNDVGASGVTYMRRFVQICPAVNDHPEMTDKAFRLYYALRRHMNWCTGKVEVLQRTLVKVARIGDWRTFHNAESLLLRIGCLRVMVKPNKRKIYTVLCPEHGLELPDPKWKHPGVLQSRNAGNLQSARLENHSLPITPIQIPTPEGESSDQPPLRGNDDRKNQGNGKSINPIRHSGPMNLSTLVREVTPGLLGNVDTPPHA